MGSLMRLKGREGAKSRRSAVPGGTHGVKVQGYRAVFAQDVRVDGVALQLEWIQSKSYTQRATVFVEGELGFFCVTQPLGATSKRYTGNVTRLLPMRRCDCTYEPYSVL